MGLILKQSGIDRQSKFWQKNDKSAEREKTKKKVKREDKTKMSMKKMKYSR